MKLLGRTKNKVPKYKSGEYVLHLGINEVLLVHCNIVNNDYQLDSRELYRFVSNRSFDQLLDISPKIFILLKAFHLEISFMGVWFTDQCPKPAEIEENIDITLVIN